MHAPYPTCSRFGTLPAVDQSILQATGVQLEPIYVPQTTIDRGPKNGGLTRHPMVVRLSKADVIWVDVGVELNKPLTESVVSGKSPDLLEYWTNAIYGYRRWTTEWRIQHRSYERHSLDFIFGTGLTLLDQFIRSMRIEGKHRVDLFTSVTYVTSLLFWLCYNKGGRWLHYNPVEDQRPYSENMPPYLFVVFPSDFRLRSRKELDNMKPTEARDYIKLAQRCTISDFAYIILAQVARQFSVFGIGDDKDSEVSPDLLNQRSDGSAYTHITNNRQKNYMLTLTSRHFHRITIQRLWEQFHTASLKKPLRNTQTVRFYPQCDLRTTKLDFREKKPGYDTYPMLFTHTLFEPGGLGLVPDAVNSLLSSLRQLDSTRMCEDEDVVPNFQDIFKLLDVYCSVMPRGDWKYITGPVMREARRYCKNSKVSRKRRRDSLDDIAEELALPQEYKTDSVQACKDAIENYRKGIGSDVALNDVHQVKWLRGLFLYHNSVFRTPPVSLLSKPLAKYEGSPEYMSLPFLRSCLQGRRLDQDFFYEQMDLREVFSDERYIARAVRREAVEQRPDPARFRVFEVDKGQDYVIVVPPRYQADISHVHGLWFRHLLRGSLGSLGSWLVFLTFAAIGAREEDILQTTRLVMNVGDRDVDLLCFQRDLLGQYLLYKDRLVLQFRRVCERIGLDESSVVDAERRQWNGVVAYKATPELIKSLFNDIHVRRILEGMKIQVLQEGKVYDDSSLVLQHLRTCVTRLDGNVDIPIQLLHQLPQCEIQATDGQKQVKLPGVLAFARYLVRKVETDILEPVVLFLQSVMPPILTRIEGNGRYDEPSKTPNDTPGFRRTVESIGNKVRKELRKTQVSTELQIYETCDSKLEADEHAFLTYSLSLLNTEDKQNKSTIQCIRKLLERSQEEKKQLRSPAWTAAWRLLRASIDNFRVVTLETGLAAFRHLAQDPKFDTLAGPAVMKELDHMVKQLCAENRVREACKKQTREMATASKDPFFKVWLELPNSFLK